MEPDTEEARRRLHRLRMMMAFYRSQGAVENGLLDAIRYRLVLEAVDLNGDECGFPACACPWPNCSQRPEAPKLGAWPGA